MGTRWVNNRGAALVEFAIVAVLLIILVMGTIDFALLAKDHTMLSNAVEAGARQAQLGQSSTTVNAVVQSSASTLVKDKITVHSYYRVADAAGIYPSSWTSGTPDNITVGSNVQVKVTAEYRSNRISGALFGANPVTISSECVQLME